MMIRKVIGTFVILMQLLAINVPIGAYAESTEDLGTVTAHEISEVRDHHDKNMSIDHHEMETTGDSSNHCDEKPDCDNCDDNLCGSICHCPASGLILSSNINLPTTSFTTNHSYVTSLIAITTKSIYRPPIV